jgi:hypothetical protein
MKRTQRNVFLAGLLVLSLSACSSWGSWKNPFGSGAASSTPTSSGTEGAAGTGGAAGTSGGAGTSGSSEKPTTNGNGAPTNGQRP